MQFLADRGVSHVFVLPGGGAIHLVDSLGSCESLDYTCFLHEQALAIATEAYGQYTNTPGVGLVTSGPGATNATTGVAAAFIDSTPCLFISGQAKRADLKGTTGVRQMGPQEVDIVSMVSPVTKYAVTVFEPSEIRYHLERAWHEATTGRMGPVWVDIPMDVQAVEIDPTALAGFTPTDVYTWSPDADDTLERVAALLDSAVRPLILAGNGVSRAGAEQLLVEFAEANQVPVLLTWKAIDLLDYEHPLNFGSPGILGGRTANFIVQNCDLLLVIGSRLDSSLTAFNPAAFGKHAKKVMVDIDAAEIRKIEGVEVPLVADAKSFMEALQATPLKAPGGDRKLWLDYCRQLRERYPAVLDEHREVADGVNLYVFTEALFNHLEGDDLITPESSGAAGEVIYQAARVTKGQKIRNAAGLGAMGFGLPYAIGACIACDQRRTILVDGDGAFQLNIQELQTLARLQLPVKIFILENGGYASIRMTQNNMFDGRYVASSPESGLTFPDNGVVAAAYGIRCERATSHADLDEAIVRTLAGDDPAVCIVSVSPSQVTAPKVAAMKTPEGSMISKPLEDMWPYLEAEEIERNMIAESGEKSRTKGVAQS